MVTAQTKDILRASRQQKRNQHELANLGNFTPIYLGEPVEKYDSFLKAAMKIWQDFTGAKKFNPVLSKSPNTLSKRNNTNAGTASSTAATSKSSNKLSENAKNQRSSHNFNTIKDLNRNSSKSILGEKMRQTSQGQTSFNHQK